MSSHLKLYSRIFRTFAFVALLIHLYIVCHEYFQYATSTSYTTESVHSHDLYTTIPNVAICGRYTDILDYNSLRSLMGKVVNRTDSDVEMAEMQSRLTLRQIFDLTPHAKSLLSYCYFRSKDGLNLDRHWRADCFRRFSIDRFFMNHYMCYVVRPKPEFFFSLPISRIAISSPSILYGVHLSPQFSGLNLIHVNIYYQSYPFASFEYGSVISRMEDFYRFIAHYRTITYTYYWFDMKLLPAPYDTTCHETHLCLHACWDRVQDRVGKIMASRVVPEFSDMDFERKHVLYTDLWNDTFRKILGHDLHDCEDECRGVWCDFSFSITDVDGSRTAINPNDSLTVLVKGEKAPGVLARALPRTDLMALALYISSCLEIWIGVHFLSTRTLFKRLYRKVRRRRRRLSRERRKSYRSRK